MTQQVTRYEPRGSAISAYNEEEIEILKTQIAPNTTDKELVYFLTVAQQRHLSPIKGQIFAIKRAVYDKAKGGYVDKMTIQVAHAGLLALAERTKGYQGTTDPLFAGEDGQWTDVWLSPKPPAACKVGVYRKGFAAPVMGVALWREYVQTNKDGKPMGLWETKQTHMLEKCALSKALRRAFPDMEEVDDEDVVTAPDEVAEYVETEPVPLRANVAMPFSPPRGTPSMYDEFWGEELPAPAPEPTVPPEPTVLANDATGETIVVPAEDRSAAADARLGDVVAKARQKLAPKPRERVVDPVATEPFTPDYNDTDAQSALWARVKVWAAEHGTDPHRLRFYLATQDGVPENVTMASLKAWLTARPENTLDRLYELYTDGEGRQQAAGDTASQQGELV